MVYPVIKQSIHMVVIYSLAYSLIFLLGICGNVLVISVVYRNPRMHNVTNYFIVNLAFADMSVCIVCLPITLLSNLYTGKRIILNKNTKFRGDRHLLLGNDCCVNQMFGGLGKTPVNIKAPRKYTVHHQ